jgi:Rod binding domain-containing protein
MTLSSKADFYLNFQKLGDLKLLARNQSEEASIAVAQQFEGLFLQQMLAAMRSASQIESSQHSSYVDFYQEMHDKQLAQTIAKQGNLGVAKLIMQQLPGGNTIPTQEPMQALPLNNPGLIAGIANTDLKEAKAVVDEAPSPVKEGATKAEAEGYKKQLEEAGATVELK